MAHAIELNGPVAVELLLQAILQGLGEVDMLRLRFAERDGVPVQWWDNTLAVHEPELVDLTTSPDPEAAARADGHRSGERFARRQRRAAVSPCGDAPRG